VATDHVFDPGSIECPGTRDFAFVEALYDVRSKHTHCPLTPTHTIDLLRSDGRRRGDKSVATLEIAIVRPTRLTWRWPCLGNQSTSDEVTVSEQKPEKPRKQRADVRGLSRRSFLTTAGTAGVIAALDGRDLMAQSPSADPPPVDDRVGTEPVTLRVNGKEHRLRIDPRTTLLDCLRETMALTGTKKGCDHGQCGACTVHVNGRRVNSCLSLALMHDGEEITTIEGLGTPDALHPMQAAFVEHDGYQCGYCTSGQIMSAVALLKEPCGPDDTAVKELMSGNICRCGAYPNIVAAIQHVRRTA
jgi:xanthine dehydrogenase YagT iron-sulfur-binding subunit